MTTTQAVEPRRGGPFHWWWSFRSMLAWELVRMRTIVPIAALVQTFTGAGLVLGFGILIGDPDPRRMAFLASGAVVISLITVGMVVGPQLVVQQRLSGQYDYLASLPVPRSAMVAAWTLVNAAVALPGAAVGLLVAVWRYELGLDPSWLLFPAVVLVLLAGALIGQAYAVSIPDPRTVAVVAQLLVFVIFGFAPIAYPVDNLPTWLGSVHAVLPFEPMADVVRAGLRSDLGSEPMRSFAVLGAWTVAASLLAAVAVRRRP